MLIRAEATPDGQRNGGVNCVTDIDAILGPSGLSDGERRFYADEVRSGNAPMG